MRSFRVISAFLGLAFGALASLCSYAAPQPVEYMYAALRQADELPAVSAKRLELTLVSWRTGSEPAGPTLASGLRGESNHFVMATVEPLTYTIT